MQGFLIPSKLSNLHGHGGIAAKITKMWKYVISKLFCIVLKNWYNEEGWQKGTQKSKSKKEDEQIVTSCHPILLVWYMNILT